MLVLDKTTTGDGLISALQVLAVLQETGKPLSQLVAGMPKYPQTMINVRMEQRLDPGASPVIKDAVALAEGETGRYRACRPACLGHRAGNPRHGRGRR